MRCEVLHLPVLTVKGACVLTANKNGLVITRDFTRYVKACGWWNEHIAGVNSEYPRLSSPQMLVGTDNVGLFTCDEHMDSYDIKCSNTGEFVMSVNKITGVIDSNTYKDIFLEFILDWNCILDGKGLVKRSTVVGSVFPTEEVEW
ncbi:MAG: hypothetical protein NC131_19015 [Roseburia sp.]|nr:hypothetical protein [Roseburia sp.]